MDKSRSIITCTNRIESIDVAKGIGIIFVVLGHIINGSSLLNKWIFTFHMPLFFIISGICFSTKKYPNFYPFAIKRIKQLIVPLLCFTLFHIIFTPSYYGLQQLISVFPGATWFVFILFCAELLYYGAIRFIRTLPILIVFFLGGDGNFYRIMQI